MNFITLLPAYGRDYKSKKAILNDLNALKDFLVSHTGQYINKPQFKELNISSFNVLYDKHYKYKNRRFKKMTSYIFLNVKKGKSKAIKFKDYKKEIKSKGDLKNDL